MTLALLLLGCGGGEALTDAQLRDPESCAECHPSHYREWSGSMHAYAADDPVFIAMNERGQRETNGELGSFCVNCHAPVAVELGLTTDGLNLDELPQSAKGVTCWYCHTVDAVEGTHNNPLRLAADGLLRGGIVDPRDPVAHEGAYSALHDRNQLESADLCGSCHDIVTGHGAHIERTYLEWQESLYSSPDVGFKLTCGACHMRGRDDVAADVDGVPLRRVHDHSMPGVDLALIKWPEAEAQRAAVQDSLDSTVRASLCASQVAGLGLATITLENVAAGHTFPSGASAERRVWVEVVAYDDAGNIGFQSGVLADDMPLDQLEDANLWTLHDTLLDDIGQPVHMFWEAYDYTSFGLAAPARGSAVGDTAGHQSRNYVIADFEAARITMALKIRAIGHDVLDDLVESGDLDATLRSETMTLAGTVLEWTPETGVPSGDLTCVQ
jgi:hypothetical protein